MRRLVYQLRTEGRHAGAGSHRRRARRIRRLLAVVRLPPRDLLGPRLAAASEPPEDVSGGQHLQPAGRAVPDPRRAADRCVDPPRRRRTRSPSTPSAPPIHGRSAPTSSSAASSSARVLGHRPRARDLAEHARRVIADPVFGALVTRAADRYLATSITAWEFARGKMRGDPLVSDGADGGALGSGRRRSSTSAAARA